MKQNPKAQESKGRGKALFLLFFFLLSLVGILLGVLCLYGASNAFVQKHALALSLGLCLLFCLLCGVSVYCTLAGKETLYKGMLSVYILLVFAFSICLLLQRTGFFQLVDSSEKLQEYLKRAGVWMPIMYIVLQFLQVVILPIPSVVSTVAGVALFGAFWAMIYSIAGILLGSFVAFLIGRKLGYKAVSWMVGEETLIKWQKKLKGKDNLFLTLMFVLPIFPDDVLCFVAGLSTMSMKYFLLIILLSRAVGIAATCYSVDFIPFNTWWGILLWILLAVIIAFVFVFIYRNIDKIQRWFKRICKKEKKRK